MPTGDQKDRYADTTFHLCFYSGTCNKNITWRTSLVQASIVSETGYPTVSYEQVQAGLCRYLKRPVTALIYHHEFLILMLAYITRTTMYLQSWAVRYAVNRI
jgi:hypothetical protein